MEDVARYITEHVARKVSKLGDLVADQMVCVEPNCLLVGRDVNMILASVFILQLPCHLLRHCHQAIVDLVQQALAISDWDTFLVKVL
jgi:hypothetical protein